MSPNRFTQYIMLLLVTLTSGFLSARDARTESYLGNLAPVARSIHEERGFPLDYAHRGDLSVDEWRRRARAEVKEQLSYWPATVPLDLKVDSVVQRDGYEIRVISFAGSPHYRIPACLLVPDGSGSFPGIVALHDHGGWFYHGKEKLVRMDGEHVVHVRPIRAACVFGPSRHCFAGGA
ncbi:MAG: hypothetical protein ACREIA_23925 [Opitutaceae bacterium]